MSVRRTGVNEAPGCLIVPALIVVVPLRLLWELLALIKRAVRDRILRPIGWLLYQGVVRPVGWLVRVLIVIPLRWIGRVILASLARAVQRYLLRPIGWLLGWCVALILLPFVYAGQWIGRGLLALWRVVWPLFAALGRAIVYLWGLAGIVLFHLLVRPARWLCRTLVRPVLIALARAWRVAVQAPARWLRVNIGKPVEAAVRSVFRGLGLDTRRP